MTGLPVSNENMSTIISWMQLVRRRWCAWVAIAFSKNLTLEQIFC